MWFIMQGVPTPEFFGYKSWHPSVESDALRFALLFSHSIESAEAIELDFQRIVSRARDDLARVFVELRVSEVSVTEGSILVTILIGSAVIKIGAAEAAAAGVGIWAITKVGGSALEQFGKRIGDLVYEAIPEKLRGRRRDARLEAGAVASRLAEERKCQGVVATSGGIKMNGSVRYRYKFLPAGCGPVGVIIDVPTKNAEEPSFYVEE